MEQRENQEQENQQQQQQKSQQPLPIRREQEGSQSSQLNRYASVKQQLQGNVAIRNNTSPNGGSSAYAALLKKNNSRQPHVELAIGMTGVGKTYTTIQICIGYTKNNPQTGKRGRRCIIFDTNMEKEFKKFFPLELRKFEINAYLEPKVRRILPFNEDGSPMDDEDQRAMATFLGKNCYNALLVLEDFDNYFRGAKTRDISKLFTSFRHRGLDVIITHQSLNPIQRIEWYSAKIVRLHKTSDSVRTIEDRVPNPEIFYIAEFIVDEQFNLAESMYAQGKLNQFEWKKRRSYFVYVDIRLNKIKGGFSKECFIRNCRKYLNLKKQLISDFMSIHVDVKGRPKYNREQAITMYINKNLYRYFDGQQIKK